MYELEKCLDLQKRIQEINEKIEELNVKIRFPKAQIMSDMPRSTSPTNPVESYIITKEKLCTKKLSLEALLEISWGGVKDKLSIANLDGEGVTVEEISLLTNRFYLGYSWKKCTQIMAKNDSKWNDNKTFRVYRKIMKKLQKV